MPVRWWGKAGAGEHGQPRRGSTRVVILGGLDHARHITDHDLNVPTAGAEAITLKREERPTPNGPTRW